MEMGCRMNKQKVNLAETFKVDTNALVEEPELTVVESEKKRHIGGHFSEDVYRQMKVLAAEKGLTTQKFLEEAFNAYFVLNDKPPIA